MCIRDRFTDAELCRRTPGHSSFIDLFNKHGVRIVRIMDLSGDSIHDYSLGILTRNCREPVSYTHLDVYKRKFPA